MHFSSGNSEVVDLTAYSPVPKALSAWTIHRTDLTDKVRASENGILHQMRYELRTRATERAARHLRASG